MTWFNNICSGVYNGLARAGNAVQRWWRGDSQQSSAALFKNNIQYFAIRFITPLIALFILRAWFHQLEEKGDAANATLSEVTVDIALALGLSLANALWGMQDLRKTTEDDDKAQAIDDDFPELNAWRKHLSVLNEKLKADLRVKQVAGRQDVELKSPQYLRQHFGNQQVISRARDLLVQMEQASQPDVSMGYCSTALKMITQFFTGFTPVPCVGIAAFFFASVFGLPWAISFVAAGSLYGIEAAVKEYYRLQELPAKTRKQVGRFNQLLSETQRLACLIIGRNDQLEQRAHLPVVQARALLSQLSDHVNINEYLQRHEQPAFDNGQDLERPDINELTKLFNRRKIVPQVEAGGNDLGIPLVEQRQNMYQ